MKAPAAAPESVERRILVCDDERHVTRLLKVSLERLGHTVLCVHDGKEAIDFLQVEGILHGRGHLDRVVLDVMMPRMDGIETLNWIRRHEQAQRLWVGLMMTGPMDRDLLDSLPYQADAYFLKPFPPTDLLL